MSINTSLLIRHKLSDTLRNYWFQVVSLYRYFSYKPGSERLVKPPKGYVVSLYDDFSGPLDMSEWRYAMPWGTFHPKNLNQYYGTDESFSYTNEEGLNLSILNKPKEFIKDDLESWQKTPDMPDRFTIPVGVGYISSKKSWKYGWFEAWIKLPAGQKYWPAFWTSGKNTWPPEIDVFEAYSHLTPLYGGGIFKLPWRNISPNLHYGSVEEGSKKQYGPYNNPVKSMTDRFVQYVCHWEEDFIKIYYDGSPVFICTDKDILSWFNRENAEQFVILNHGLHHYYPETPDESSMVVRSFRALQRDF